MDKYFIQEKIGDYWFDLYTSDLCMLKKMILVLKKRSPNSKFRIIGVYI